MARKFVTPGALFNLARRHYFAARALALSTQAAHQVHQLALSMNTRRHLEELTQPANDAFAPAGGPSAPPFLGPRSRALSREMERQLAVLQQTIHKLQALAQRQERP